VTTDLVDINLGLRILLGSSFYDDWQGGETFVKADPLGNAIDQRHPWNQTTTPKPQTMKAVSSAVRTLVITMSPTA